MSDDFDPPGFSQPTLPPPEVEEKRPQKPRRFGVTVIGGGLVALSGATAAAYALLPHGHADPVKSAAAAAPSTVTAHLDRILAAFPQGTGAEQTCTGAAGERMPVLLHSSLKALVAGTESAELASGYFNGVAAATEAKMVTGHRIAVLRTVELREPKHSLGEPAPGRYEAELVVFDTTTHAPICQTKVVAWSSATMTLAKVSPHALKDDFILRMRTALAEGAQRINVDLDL